MEAHKLATKFDEHNENTNYWTDGKKVYFRGDEVKGADIESFVQYPGGWGKDKKHCYLVGSRLQNADLTTFEVLNFTFAKDNTSAWTLGGRIDIDSDTFEVCDSGANVNIAIIAGEQYTLTTPYGYAKDKNAVYHYDYSGKTNIVKKAIPQSFVSLNDSRFGYDEKSVFCKISVLPKANPKTWKKLHDDYYYSRDGNRIYYFNRLMKDADAESFEILVTPDLFRNPGQYARDKNNYYLNDNIHPETEIKKMIENDIERDRKLREKFKL